MENKKLSQQENQVFSLLKAGLNENEIAEKLNISFNTVKVYEYRLFKKTGFKGRMEILANEIKRIKEI